MGLDWITSSNIDYEGPNYHRAKGLAWVLESCGFPETAEKCYGEEKGDNSIELSNQQMEDILRDLRIIRNKNKYPECITEEIEMEELNEHLEEAETMLDMVINFKGDSKLVIYADY